MAQQIWTQGFGGSLVILLTGSWETEFAGEVFQTAAASLPGISFALAAYETPDWDGDFSPWAYRMENGRSFAGHGRATLARLQSCFSETAGKYGHVYLAGYSLAGLFALWAVHETDFFDGCVCSSGSLWFAGWEEYTQTHSLKKPGQIYLSLGGKEEKAKDSVLATIGEKTRKEEKRLSADPMVQRHTLVMNPGGHFASPEKRLAQGMVWLLGKE